MFFAISKSVTQQTAKTNNTSVTNHLANYNQLFFKLCGLAKNSQLTYRLRHTSSWTPCTASARSWCPLLLTRKSGWQAQFLCTQNVVIAHAHCYFRTMPVHIRTYICIINWLIIANYPKLHIYIIECIHTFYIHTRSSFYRSFPGQILYFFVIPIQNEYTSIKKI